MGYLDGIDVNVIPTDKGYDVIYNVGEYSGSVTYVKYVMNNLLMRNKPVYLMVTSDMGDIIEVIHQRKPLSSTDLNGLSMEIRNHSMGMVNKFGK
jgi:hypothetical protein